MKQFPNILRFLSVAFALSWTCSATAQQNIVVDGGFEQTAPNSSSFSSAWVLIPASGTNPGQQFSNVGTSTTTDPEHDSGRELHAEIFPR
jgi:hypothetical protein